MPPLIDNISCGGKLAGGQEETMQTMTTSIVQPCTAPRGRHLLTESEFQQAIPHAGQDIVRAACLQAMATDTDTGIDEVDPGLFRRRLPRKG